MKNKGKNFYFKQDFVTDLWETLSLELCFRDPLLYRASLKKGTWKTNEKEIKCQMS